MGFFDIFKTKQLKEENSQLRRQLAEITFSTERLKEKDDAKISIENLKIELADLEEFKNKQIETAKKDAVRQIEDEINKRQEVLNTINLNVSELEQKHESINRDIEEFNRKVFANNKSIERNLILLKSLKKAKSKNFSALSISDESFDNNLILEAENALATTVELKINCMDIKRLRETFKNNKYAISEIYKKYEKRYTTKTNQTIYQLMVIGLEAELQNILYKLTYSKLDDAIKDMRTLVKTYFGIAAVGNQQILPTIKSFLDEIEYLYLEAIKIEHEYHKEKERIKAEQQAIRDQMKEDAIERKKLQEEMRRLEEEEQKYKNEIQQVNEQLNATSDEKEVEALRARIAELENMSKDLELKKEDIVKLEHGKAGYVYVISNLGAFGDSVFKIGMTRRVDPYDRISELSSASVPFPFDVHGMIFSENAVDLENDLHKRLNDKRLNKVNLRKEFFNIDINELENVVHEYSPTVIFTKTLLAEQYLQSISDESLDSNV